MPLKNQEQQRPECEQQPSLTWSESRCTGALFTPQIPFLPTAEKLLVGLVRIVGIQMRLSVSLEPGQCLETCAVPRLLGFVNSNLPCAGHPEELISPHFASSSGLPGC